MRLIENSQDVKSRNQGIVMSIGFHLLAEYTVEMKQDFN